MKTWYFLLFFTLISLGVKAKSWLVPEGENLLDGNGNYAQVNPGDTVFLTGTKNLLIIRNFSGTKAQNITFSNLENQVFKINATGGFGLSVQNCEFIRVKGQNVDGQKGIQIKVPNGVGVGVGYLSQNWELNNLEIGPSKAPGILAKTDPDCSFSSTRENFKQIGGKILHCYIHDAGTEGIYFGSSAYEGLKVNCGGKDTNLIPHLIEHGEIAYNLVENTGWDAIQVASALHTSIHHNTIIGDSQNEQTSHQNGIIAGLGFSGRIYNNLIINGNGNGIFSMARDSLLIDNNVIINPGYRSKNGGRYGIFVNLENPEIRVLQVCNNLILNPRYQGFHARLSNQISFSSFINNVISWNDSLYGNSQELISDPLTKLMYSHNNHISTNDNLDTYYFIQDSLDQRKNGFTTDQGTLPDLAIATDFWNRPRVDASGKIDIGPFEYQASTTGIAARPAADPNCLKEITTSLKLEPESIKLVSLEGKVFSGKVWSQLPPATYIVLHGTCRIALQKQ